MGTLIIPQQHRSLRFTPNPSAGHNPTPLFNALGSGALARLHTLQIERFERFPVPQEVVVGDANLLPNSLPSLRKLSIDLPMSSGLLGGIFAAAGLSLTTISITNGETIPIAMRLLGETDYVWAPALQPLNLYWECARVGGGAQPLDPDTPLLAIDALAHLPALKSLVLRAREPDELLVRLLALAEADGLPNLATLYLQGWGQSFTGGAMLLLLLWLKREAKKALQGEEEAALWNVPRLYPDQKHITLKQIIETHLTQLKEARMQIRKARAAGGAVV
jgi:hypothetical protein